MAIPFSIRIFNIVYESGKYLLPALLTLWLVWLICVIIQRKRKQFFWTSAVFIGIFIIGGVFTWSGWHYRMKLYERYALVQPNADNSSRQKTYDLDRMPAEVRREYAKNHYRPRQRQVYGQIVWVLLLTPITLLGQWLLYLLFFRRKKQAENPDAPAILPDWKFRLARAGFIAGAILGFGSVCMIGDITNWLLCSCIPLILPLYFGKWKNWRIPAIILTLIFLYFGTVSCILAARRSRKILKAKYKTEFLTSAQKPGCLGAKVFNDPEWQKYFAELKQNPDKFEFLLFLFPDTAETKIHICNFENASTGVLAVMIAEKITGSSWTNYDGNDQLLITAVNQAKTAFPQHAPLKKVLTAPASCRELQEFFRKAYSGK